MCAAHPALRRCLKAEVHHSKSGDHMGRSSVEKGAGPRLPTCGFVFDVNLQDFEAPEGVTAQTKAPNGITKTPAIYQKRIHMSKTCVKPIMIINN